TPRTRSRASGASGASRSSCGSTPTASPPARRRCATRATRDGAPCAPDLRRALDVRRLNVRHADIEPELGERPDERRRLGIVPLLRALLVERGLGNELAAQLPELLPLRVRDHLRMTEWEDGRVLLADGLARGWVHDLVRHRHRAQLARNLFFPLNDVDC